MPTLKISDLNKIYSDSDNCDSQVFAEQRGNIRLVNGDHFTKRNKFYWNRFRETANVPNEQKIRMSQNHIHNISKTYVNSILAISQDAVILPRNESELQDQKSSELNSSVWEDIKLGNDWENRKLQLCSDYIDAGEVAVKCFFNQAVGEIVDYEVEVGQDGAPLLDQMGQPVKSNRPIRKGKIEVKRILAFNLLREPGAKSKEESQYLIERYMLPVAEAKKWVAGDEEKLDFVRKSSDETYKVFNGATGEYDDSKDQVMIREYYYKPNNDYPNGYYYITTPFGILFEGELPFGIFPIRWCGFDDIPTSARSNSIIKQLRTFQAEINRCVSSMVEIQLSNGMDKIFLQGGGKISPMQYTPGVKAFSINGAPPTVIQGRTGDQFLAYLDFQIREMYRISKIEELSLEKSMTMDPYAMLFMDSRQKKAFSMYAAKFGRFLNDICQTCLELARNYYDEQMLIPVVGKSEVVNIPEFLSSDPLSYKIKIIEGNSDVGSQVGKQLAISQILQYSAGNLSREDVGRLIRNMPYFNKEEVSDDLTIDYDSAKNMILALDRGEMPVVIKEDNHKYLIKRLTLRMRQSDFKQLHPQIQQNYIDTRELCQQFEALIAQELQFAQSGFIPATSQLMVGVDYYVMADGKQKRVRVPQDSIQWLIEKLNSQGSYFEQIDATLSDADKIGVSKYLQNNGGQGSQSLNSGMPSQGSEQQPSFMGAQ